MGTPYVAASKTNDHFSTKKLAITRRMRQFTLIFADAHLAPRSGANVFPLLAPSTYNTLIATSPDRPTYLLVL